MEQKNQSVAHVLQNKFVICIFLIISNISFANGQCNILSRGVFKNSKISPEIEFINSFMTKLQNKEYRSLETFFHPKLRVKKSIGLRIKTVLNSKLISPLNFSIYRVWEFLNAEKQPLKCDQKDTFNVIPRYGYKKQYGAMISVLAENDLARIYMSYARKENEFKITGLHIQQWTHSGHDYSYWIDKSFTENLNINKWIDLDVAKKLLVGGDFLEYPIKMRNQCETSDTSPSKGSIKEIKSGCKKSNNIVYFGSLLRQALYRNLHSCYNRRTDARI